MRNIGSSLAEIELTSLNEEGVDGEAGDADAAAVAAAFMSFLILGRVVRRCPRISSS